MLHIAESVAKRSRKETEYISAQGGGDSGKVGAQERAVLRLGVEAGRTAINGAREDGFGVNNEWTKSAASRLSLSRHFSAPAANRVKVTLDVENIEQRQDWLAYDDAESSLDGRSWDEITVPSASICELKRELDYDGDTKSQIVTAAVNAALGFVSEYVLWNSSSLLLELHPALQTTSFAAYLKQFARTGTLIRRLGLAISDIRRLSINNDNRTVLAVAATIEKELSLHLKGLEARKEYKLIQLASECASRNSEIETLAELVGCSGTRGRLSRLPSAIELLQRIYLRMCTLDSAMMWRIGFTALIPWLEQLDFVIGLSSVFTVRRPDAQAKQAYFPELFIDVAEETASLSLIVDQVPSFLPPVFATAAVDCYRLLCYLGMKGPEAMNRSAGTSLMPIRAALSVIDANREGAKLIITNVERNDISNGFKEVESLQRKIEEPQPQPKQDSPHISRYNPSSVKHEMRKLMNTVFFRHLELDKRVKSEFLTELTEFANVVIGVYFANDGVLWSQLSDLTDEILNNWSQPSSRRYLGALNALVSARYAVLVTMDSAKWGNLAIAYQPAYMNAMLGSAVLTKCQKIFSKLILLHYNKHETELALLGADLDILSARIRNALTDPASGMREVKAAFELIPNS